MIRASATVEWRRIGEVREVSTRERPAGDARSGDAWSGALAAPERARFDVARAADAEADTGALFRRLRALDMMCD